jgi:positive regulator of sigma E activity
LALAVGQWVTIGTIESNVLIAASITYLLPLVGLLSASVFAQSLLVERWGFASYSAVLVGIAGGFVAQRFGRYWLKNSSKSQPEIVIVNGGFS